MNECTVKELKDMTVGEIKELKVEDFIGLNKESAVDETTTEK